MKLWCPFVSRGFGFIDYSVCVGNCRRLMWFEMKGSVLLLQDKEYLEIYLNLGTVHREEI